MSLPIRRISVIGGGSSQLKRLRPDFIDTAKKKKKKEGGKPSWENRSEMSVVPNLISLKTHVAYLFKTEPKVAYNYTMSSQINNRADAATSKLRACCERFEHDWWSFSQLSSLVKSAGRSLSVWFWQSIASVPVTLTILQYALCTITRQDDAACGNPHNLKWAGFIRSWSKHGEDKSWKWSGIWRNTGHDEDLPPTTKLLWNFPRNWLYTPLSNIGAT